MLLRGYIVRHGIRLLIFLAVLLASASALEADTLPQPLNSWEYRWGDSPPNVDGTPAWLYSDAIEWESTASPSNPPGREGHQHLWLRTTLPEGEWNDPVLFITSINLIGQAYLGDQLIYQYGEFDEQGRGEFAGWPWHMIDLPDDAAGQILTFRLYSYYTSIGLWGQVQVMERIEVLKQVIHDSAQDLGVSALVLVLAILASIFALIGPERRGFGAIALFAFATGLMLIAEAPARQLIASDALMWDTLRAGSYYTLPVALGLLLSHWLEGSAKRWLTQLWRLHLAYLIVAISLVKLGFISLSMTFPIFDALLAVTLPVMLMLALFRFPKLSLEQRLLVVSFTFFAPLLVTDMLVAHGFISWRPIPLSYGTLAFSLANAAIFLWHYRRTQQSLAISNETLELQVAARTAELDRLVHELEGLSFEDPLTGLHNRRHFNTVFDHECRRAQQNSSHLSLLMLDVDHFKKINDHFGHDAGDSVLVEIASRLRQHFHGMDVVCRFGGEEFIALLPATSVNAAQEHANALLKAVSQQAMIYHGEPLGQVTLSCGVASFPNHTEEPQKLLRLADEALYQAKHSGRNRCVVWAESHQAQQFMLATEGSSIGLMARVNRSPESDQ
ncbi:GGDEF domain-containing protein [Vreelandella neptunia]|uniref:diguanylate cyclase n=1 Tax=Vreelandella neptunia TaxID=115551 RepID=A0ABS9S4P1_9GAMM|nr:GGDEF domain-containing protein [Halomonas neptunia]MCH4811082.1 GGDEF domain-containing protein [Halomonas neptunia]